MARKSTALALAAAMAFSLSACGSAGSGSASAPAAEGTLDVSASFYPTAFLVERVGGEHVSVSTVTPSDVEPHEYELSPAAVTDLSKKDLVVYVSGFQPSLDEAIRQVGLDETHAADLAAAVDLVAYDIDGHESGADADHEDADHDEEHEDGEGHEHRHGAYDPHFWLDPERMANAADAVAAALAKTDPDNAKDYEAGAEALKADLDKLDAEFEAGLLDSGSKSACESNVLVSPHSAFGYLASAYGLQVRAIAADAESEPSPARLAELSRQIQDAGATAIFAEARASTSSIEALAKEANVEVETLDPLELKPASGDYLSVMRENLAALKSGLRCG